MFKYFALFILITSIYFASVQHLLIPKDKNPFLEPISKIEQASRDIINHINKIQEKKRLEKEEAQKLAIRKALMEKRLKERQRQKRELYAQRVIAKKLKKIEKMRKEAQERFEKLEKEKLEKLERLEIARLAKERELKANAIIAKIDISEQRMRVYRGDNLLYKWKVSTGRKGYYTPRGKYTPKYMTKMHYSRKYHNSPMPYSIFFNYKGYAIHGTKSVHRLGTPASHGCVRLHTKNAKSLFKLIQKSGKKNAIIHITN